MSNETTERYIKKIRTAISEKPNTYKKIMLMYSEELLYLKNHYYTYILYEKLKGDSKFIHIDVFYKYLKLISDNEKNNLEFNIP